MIDRLLELAALDAAGALGPAAQAELRRLLESAPEAVRLEIASLYDSAAALPANLEPETPSPTVRARILSHAGRRG